MPAWLVAVRARPIVFPAYLLWRDVVEIDGQRHKFRGVVRRFRNERALVEYFGRQAVLPGSSAVPSR